MTNTSSSARKSACFWHLAFHNFDKNTGCSSLWSFWVCSSYFFSFFPSFILLSEAYQTVSGINQADRNKGRIIECSDKPPLLPFKASSLLSPITITSSHAAITRRKNRRITRLKWKDNSWQGNHLSYSLLWNFYHCICICFKWPWGKCPEILHHRVFRQERKKENTKGKKKKRKTSINMKKNIISFKGWQMGGGLIIR